MTPPHIECILSLVKNNLNNIRYIIIKDFLTHDELKIEASEECAAVSSSTKNVLSNPIKPSVIKVINSEPEKPKSSCKKHSRCHCDLLSLETTDFFSIKV